MKEYIIKRILAMIPAIIGISLILFIIFALTPGDIVSNNMDPHMTAERKAELRAQYHLDKPKYVQYGYWLKGIVTKGSFGDSFYYKRPVSEVMKEFIPNSFLLAIVSLVLGFLIAVPIGVISATKQYSIFDKVFTVLAFIGISLPSFFFGLLLIEKLGVEWKILPFSGMITPGSNYTGIAHVWDVSKHMLYH